MNSGHMLAMGDFTELADCFAHAGFSVRLPARGIIQITSPGRGHERQGLLVSVGVHGDETAPIEMLAQVLHSLMRTPHALTVDLMVAVGNLDAIALRKRYLDADMNRLFRADRSDLASASEAGRADALMQASAAFFAVPHAGKWHLDLHAAIRPSRYPAFAVMPDAIAEEGKRALIDWLGSAEIGAVILNRKLAGTFSAYTATQFGAISCTLELGRIGALGANDLSPFVPAQRALERLLRSEQAATMPVQSPHMFHVVQEIIKHSDGFSMAFDRAIDNFTTIQPGTLIAQDGDIVYRTGNAIEYIVFPNPDVRIGQRAGLMVVRQQ